MIVRKCLLKQDQNPARQNTKPCNSTSGIWNSRWNHLDMNSFGQLCPPSSTARSSRSLCLGQAPPPCLQIFLIRSGASDILEPPLQCSSLSSDLYMMICQCLPTKSWTLPPIEWLRQLSGTLAQTLCPPLLLHLSYLQNQDHTEDMVKFCLPVEMYIVP